jgi:hypothetical protein
MVTASVMDVFSEVTVFPVPVFSEVTGFSEVTVFQLPFFRR